MKKKRETIPQGIRFNVLRRDGFTCRYCGRSSPDVVLHCDHIVAHSKGGSDDESNLVAACQDCNSGKRAKDVSRLPSSGDAPLLNFYGLEYEDGEMQYQFRIIRYLGHDLYLIQFFDFLMGYPASCEARSLFDLVDKDKYQLFPDIESWKEACKRDMWKWEQRERVKDIRELELIEASELPVN